MPVSKIFSLTYLRSHSLKVTYLLTASKILTIEPFRKQSILVAVAVDLMVTFEDLLGTNSGTQVGHAHSLLFKALKYELSDIDSEQLCRW